MKKPPSKRRSPKMKAEYDFSNGVRGKYVDRYRLGTNIVILEPDLAKVFPNSKSVNDALRALVTIASRTDSRNAPDAGTPREHATRQRYRNRKSVELRQTAE